MGFFSNLKGNKALKAQSKGDYGTAASLYEEAYKEGMNGLRQLRGYSILLIRMQQFDKALEILKKMEAQPGVTEADKADIRINYAVILWKKGHLDRALEILYREFSHKQNGTIYSILGYLLIEKGDFEEALAFNRKAVEYDDGDPVFLDNLAQTYYRLAGDKETAKTYFDKAIELKPNAIDTNYFLAMYAMEAGEYERAKEHLETSKRGVFSPLNYPTVEMIDGKLKEIAEKQGA